MKFLRLDLLTLLISLFILGSCKNQDSIGLGVNSSNQLTGSLIDTSTIFINTIPDDSITTSTSSATGIPLAYFKDPLLGITESNIAFDLNLPSGSPYTLPAGTIIVDSALLVLKYTSGFYGDSIASRYKVNVYQLNERVVSGQTYYSNKTWNYNGGTLLGTKSFLVRPTDSVKLNSQVAGNRNVLRSSVPQIRIPISQSFVNSILFNAPSSQLASNLLFKNTVKGLYVTLDKPQVTGAGGVIMLNSTEPMGSIDVYYRAINGGTVDTNMVSIASGTHAAEIKHVYSTAVQTELSNTTTTRNAFYIQGLAGLRAKISFPYLKQILVDMGSDIVINRAELVVTPDPASLVPFKPVARLNMYKYDLAHQRAMIAIDQRYIGDAIFGGYYSTVQKNYHFVITPYIEDLMRGKTVDNGTFLAAADPSSSQSSTTSSGAATRTFAIGSNGASPYRIKLNIIYTKLAK